MFYLECSHFSDKVKFFYKKCNTIEESYNRNGEAHSVVGIKYATISNGLEISFLPNCMWNEKEIYLIKKAKNTDERITHYKDTLFHPANLFFEGIIFGIKYAYKIYADSKENPGGIFVCVDYIKNSVTINHPHVAYTSANVIWKALDFEPSDPIKYNEKDDSFIFLTQISLYQ